MGWMLETIGHDYRMVHEGKLAVQTAQDYRPDAILLDIGMPGMDGYAVCRALREQPLFDDTVIIAQTGWGQTQARAAPGELGFDHHLVKPVTMDRLEELLADIASARGKILSPTEVDEGDAPVPGPTDAERRQRSLTAGRRAGQRAQSAPCPFENWPFRIRVFCAIRGGAALAPARGPTSGAPGAASHISGALT